MLLEGDVGGLVPACPPLQDWSFLPYAIARNTIFSFREPQVQAKKGSQEDQGPQGIYLEATTYEAAVSC